MKDINISRTGKSPWVSKTMQTLKDLKKWKVWDIKLKNIKKLDKELEFLWKNIEDFRDNNISKQDFDKAFKLSEKVATAIITDNYIQKYWSEPWVEIWLNRLPTEEKTKYNLWFRKDDVDSRIEKFSTVDEVLDRMKYLYG